MWVLWLLTLYGWISLENNCCFRPVWRSVIGLLSKVGSLTALYLYFISSIRLFHECRLVFDSKVMIFCPWRPSLRLYCWLFFNIPIFWEEESAIFSWVNPIIHQISYFPKDGKWVLPSNVSPVLLFWAQVNLVGPLINGSPWTARPFTRWCACWCFKTSLEQFSSLLFRSCNERLIMITELRCCLFG